MKIGLGISKLLDHDLVYKFIIYDAFLSYYSDLVGLEDKLDFAQ